MNIKQLTQKKVKVMDCESGFRHLMCDTGYGGEFTSCGRSFDDFPLGFQDYKEFKRPTITCPDCIETIQFYKKISVILFKEKSED